MDTIKLENSSKQLASNPLTDNSKHISKINKILNNRHEEIPEAYGIFSTKNEKKSKQIVFEAQIAAKNNQSGKLLSKIS